MLPIGLSSLTIKCVTDSVELKLPHLETPAEETASMLTHGLGAILSAVALTLLVVYASIAHDPRRLVSVTIYGSTLLMMYSASTIYHWVKSPRTKRLLRICDHASIYLLIAGTSTPVLIVAIQGAWGWSLFGVIWGLACVGTTLKLFFVDRYEPLSVSIYIFMGWMMLIAAKPLFAAVPMPGIALLFAGGIAYTGGVVFFAWDRLPFNHAIWHLFVIAGSVFHFLAVWFYILPMTR